MAIAQLTVHFVLLAERLEQAVLSLDKLSIKYVMQNTSDYYRYFLQPLITKEALRDRMNASNNFNCYYGNVLQSSDESTKNTNLLTYGL